MRFRLFSIVAFIYFAVIFERCWTKDGKNRKIKMSVLNIEPCRPELWKQNDSLVTYNVWSRRPSRTSQTFGYSYTLKQDFGPVNLRLRIFSVLSNTEVYQIFKIDPISCNTTDLKELLSIVKTPLDEQCVVRAGSYYLENITIADFKPLMELPFITSGRLRIECDMYDKRGLLCCQRVDFNILK